MHMTNMPTTASPASYRDRASLRADALQEERALIRDRAHCAAILEGFGEPWRLDKKESTRNALKYRRGKGEVLIVNHHGRGWWDPQSTAKGDVFALVQHLEPALSFGQVREVLRQFIGVAPAYLPVEKERQGQGDQPAVQERWARRSTLRPRSAAWRYLAETRGLPAAVLLEAGRQDIIRCGAYGSAWFAHRDQATVSHVEIRGPDFKGSLRDGHKTLFQLKGGEAPASRLVITEAPIDTLSIAALEQIHADSVYVATGGGMGPGTIAALETICRELSGRPGAVVESATDANTPGDRYANRHEEIARAFGLSFRRLRPPENLDWNNVITKDR